MSTGEMSITNALQQLWDLGIVRAVDEGDADEIDSDSEGVAAPQAAITGHTSRLRSSRGLPFDIPLEPVGSFRPVDAEVPLKKAGSLGPGFPIRSGLRQEVPVPKYQPPLFWKAMGFFLKKEFCASVDDQVILFANPRDVGVAGGRYRPEELTNYQVFQFADSMQRANRPSFSLGGYSYFEFLNSYLRNCGESDEPESLAKARNSFLAAKAKKDQAWEVARQEYIKLVSSSDVPPAKSLIEYIYENPPYKEAWDAEQKAQDELESLLPPKFASLVSQINTLRLADSRLDHQWANNMPVIAVDADWIRMQELEGKSRKDLVDPRNIYYRPCYSLPGYEATVNGWYDAVPSPSTMARSGPHDFPIGEVLTREWAELGHPLLDEAKLSEGQLTSAQIDFINSLEATLTFIQEPFVGHVTRGPWDINGSVRDLYDLLPGAPATLKDPVLKTSKLIIAWGIEIELTIPDVLPQSVDPKTRKVTLAGMDLPLQPDAGDKNKLVFRGGGRGPMLIGAIADVI